MLAHSINVLALRLHQSGQCFSSPLYRAITLIDVTKKHVNRFIYYVTKKAL